MNFRHALTILFLVISTGSIAEVSPPRGPDVGPNAGACAVGPFGQIGATEDYETFCHQLTPAEVCLAYVKGHIQSNGSVHQAHDLAKATYCARILLDRLGSRRD